MIWSIDGISWDIPCQVVREAELKASDISGLMLDATYFNDVIGTYMSYTVSIAVPFKKASIYQQIYDALTNPVDGHTFVLPYDDGTINLTGRVSDVHDEYVRLAGGITHWKGISFTVTANHPTKQLSLEEVITRGTTPVPAASSVSVGTVLEATSTGWTQVTSGEDIEY